MTAISSVVLNKPKVWGVRNVPLRLMPQPRGEGDGCALHGWALHCVRVRGERRLRAPAAGLSLRNPPGGLCVLLACFLCEVRTGQLLPGTLTALQTFPGEEGTRMQHTPDGSPFRLLIRAWRSCQWSSSVSY